MCTIGLVGTIGEIRLFRRSSSVVCTNIIWNNFPHLILFKINYGKLPNKNVTKSEEGIKNQRKNQKVHNLYVKGGRLIQIFSSVRFFCAVSPPVVFLYHCYIRYVLDSKQSWESVKFQLARWSHRLAFLCITLPQLNYQSSSTFISECGIPSWACS